MSDPHVLDASILREYDIRGIFGDTLKVDDAHVIGRAFGAILIQRRSDGDEPATVAVGYDGRLSSPELEAALVDGLVSCGLKVIRVGLGPTPMLYYATHLLGTNAGMMITGSHNPSEYNGVKMVLEGKSFFGADIQKLGRVASSGNFVSGSGEVTERPVLNDYVKRVHQDFQGSKPLTVAWDPGNGAAGDAVKMLTDELPGRHILLNAEIDGTFPAHHPDPTVEANLEQLKQTVASEQCDLGIAFDGDGDRIGVVDAGGRVLWGDQLMAIFAGEVLGELPGATIIADVKASQVLFDEIRRLGGKPLMWRTGHSLIKAKMAETGAPLAGEMSGHIFFSHRYYGYDDALYAAIRLLSIVSQSTQSLAEMRDALPAVVNTPELRFDCDDKRKFIVIDEVKQRLKSVNDISVDDIDGVRVLSDDGWWLLRASNTQPVLVARCEAADNEGLKRLKAALSEQLQASEVDPPDFLLHQSES